jgi:hypothetical protein
VFSEETTQELRKAIFFPVCQVRRVFAVQAKEIGLSIGDRLMEANFELTLLIG